MQDLKLSRFAKKLIRSIDDGNRDARKHNHIYLGVGSRRPHGPLSDEQWDESAAVFLLIVIPLGVNAAWEIIKRALFD